MNKRIAAVCFAVMISGCAGLPTKTDTYLKGQPPAYADGYRSGCSSGTAAAGNPYYRMSKDVGRAQTDETYRLGWDDGFMTCRAEYESTLNMMRRR